MLKDITLERFKSFADSQTLVLRPLTIMTGINSSGKSSVIQALRILQRVAANIPNPLIHGHGDSAELQNINSVEPFRIEATYQFGQEYDKKLAYTRSATATLPDIDFPSITYISASRYGSRIAIPVSEDYQIEEHGDNVLSVINHYQDEIIPEVLRHHNSEGDTLLFNLRAWLGEIAPGVKFEHQILSKMDSSYATYNGFRASNVGFGLSYVLPIIVALLTGTFMPNSVIAIENPEAHLHPKGQTALARLAALAAMTGTQILCETHSDHFFDGVRIFVKNHPIFADKVAIHWFEMNNDGSTKVETPAITTDGRLSYWPDGLFDQFEINGRELL